jgi:metal-responsive CopG/Arc/MetJ family transcriptional regulator
MFGNKIKLEKGLLERCKQVAEKLGYSSVDEFIAHTLEQELKDKETISDEEEISKRLKGLGYL